MKTLKKRWIKICVILPFLLVTVYTGWIYYYGWTSAAIVTLLPPSKWGFYELVIARDLPDGTNLSDWRERYVGAFKLSDIPLDGKERNGE